MFRKRALTPRIQQTTKSFSLPSALFRTIRKRSKFDTILTQLDFNSKIFHRWCFSVSDSDRRRLDGITDDVIRPMFSFRRVAFLVIKLNNDNVVTGLIRLVDLTDMVSVNASASNIVPVDFNKVVVYSLYVISLMLQFVYTGYSYNTHCSIMVSQLW